RLINVLAGVVPSSATAEEHTISNANANASANSTNQPAPPRSIGLAELSPVLVKFVNAVDPKGEEGKPLALSLLNRLNGRYGGPEVLVALHEFGNASLKRQVEYIQLSLSLLKADQIAPALSTLVATNQHPS